MSGSRPAQAGEARLTRDGTSLGTGSSSPVTTSGSVTVLSSEVVTFPVPHVPRNFKNPAPGSSSYARSLERACQRGLGPGRVLDVLALERRSGLWEVAALNQQVGLAGLKL